MYILTNQHNTTLYIGVTSNLEQRLHEHRNKVKQGFTAKYNLNKLVYFEVGNSIQTAIEREKYIKGKTRAFKNSLIASMNPEWQDLSPPCHPECSEGSPVQDKGILRYAQNDELCGGQTA